jgi:hypothetical protein
MAEDPDGPISTVPAIAEWQERAAQSVAWLCDPRRYDSSSPFWRLDELITCVPFHLSGEFMVLPIKWRWEYLFRNRAVCHQLWALEQGRHAARAVFERFGDSERSSEALTAWRELQCHAAVRRARLADLVLIRCFGMMPGTNVPDRRYGIPGCMVPALGPSDVELYGDLWSGILENAFPDLTPYRWISEPEVEGMVIGAVERLAKKYPGVSTWKELTCRGRREVNGALWDLRKRLGLFARRKIGSDAYHARLLAVWDAREGWTGRGYNPRRAVPLADARKRTKAKLRDYYRAFELVTGIPYDSDEMAWERLFGAAWQTALGRAAYHKLRSRPQLRRTGATPGPRASKLPRPVTMPIPPACSNDDPATTLEAAEVERLVELLSQGVAIDAALAEVELSESTRQKLADPANRLRIQAFFAGEAPC